MAYANGLKGTGRSTRARKYPRKGGKMAKVRFQPPSARNQRSQIMSNRRDIERLKRRTMRHLIYTDWQMRGVEFSPLIVNNNWVCQLLMAPTQWSSVMRGDPTVQRCTHTFIKRMQINGYVTLEEADRLFISIFVVTPRKQVTGRSFDPGDPINPEPPVLNVDYIESNAEPGRGIRLNPAVFKVHCAKYITLTKNALDLASTQGSAGNPLTTYRKFQINKDLNIKCSVPAYTTGPTGQPNWQSKKFQDFPYYQKYQILTYASWSGTGAANPRFVTDPLFTCINTD